MIALSGLAGIIKTGLHAMGGAPSAAAQAGCHFVRYVGHKHQSETLIDVQLALNMLLALDDAGKGHCDGARLRL